MDSGTYSEDDGADIVVKARCPHSLLVRFRCASFLGKDESCTNPDSASAEHKSSSNALSIEETTRSNDLDLVAERRLLTLAHGRNSGNENGCRDIASVSTTLATLGTDKIGADVETLLDVLGVSDHIHVEDAVLVQLVDDLFWWDTNGGDEEARAGLDDDVYELAELAFCVVVAMSAEC